MTSQQNGDLIEEVMELAENQQKIIDRQDRLIDMQDKFINELKKHISLLEEEVSLLKNTPKGCSTCKHVYCRGDREPCMSCNRCITNQCTNNLSDKWEPKA